MVCFVCLCGFCVCGYWFRGFRLFGCLFSVIGFVFWLGVALIVLVRLLGAFVLVASLLDFCWVLLELWYLICLVFGSGYGCFVALWVVVFPWFCWL